MKKIEPTNPARVFEQIVCCLGPNRYDNGALKAEDATINTENGLLGVTMIEVADDLSELPADQRTWTHKNGFIWAYLISTSDVFCWGFAASKSAAWRLARKYKPISINQE